MGPKVIGIKLLSLTLIKSSRRDIAVGFVDISHMHIPAPEPHWRVVHYCLEHVMLVWSQLFGISLHEELHIVPRLRDGVFGILLAVEGSHKLVQFIRLGLRCVAGLGIQG